MSETLASTETPASDARTSLLHSLVAQSPALIAIRANDGGYLYANDSFAQMLNLPAESLPGRHEDDVLHTAGASRALRHCGEGFEHWLARADRAMYRAKDTGRNRVVADPYSAFASDGTHMACSPVELVWRESYRSGNERVDRQHRQLFEHANRLLHAVISHAPRAEVLEAMTVLVEDITAHFADKEQLHRSIGFPAREAHAAEHGRLLAKAARLFERARQDAELPIAEVFQFLAYDVVAQHLVGADRQYFRYLEGSGGNGM